MVVPLPRRSPTWPVHRNPRRGTYGRTVLVSASLMMKSTKIVSCLTTSLCTGMPFKTPGWCSGDRRRSMLKSMGKVLDPHLLVPYSHIRRAALIKQVKHRDGDGQPQEPEEEPVHLRRAQDLDGIPQFLPSVSTGGTLLRLMFGSLGLCFRSFFVRVFNVTKSWISMLFGHRHALLFEYLSLTRWEKAGTPCPSTFLVKNFPFVIEFVYKNESWEKIKRRLDQKIGRKNVERLILFVVT